MASELRGRRPRSWICCERRLNKRRRERRQVRRNFQTWRRPPPAWPLRRVFAARERGHAGQHTEREYAKSINVYGSADRLRRREAVCAEV